MRQNYANHLWIKIMQKLAKKHGKRRFRPAFGVCSTQILVEMYKERVLSRSFWNMSCLDWLCLIYLIIIPYFLTGWQFECVFCFFCVFGPFIIDVTQIWPLALLSCQNGHNPLLCDVIHDWPLYPLCTFEFRPVTGYQVRCPWVPMKDPEKRDSPFRPD